ncbi:hypothetical protein RO3G_03941 [Rhizopus delemar RA 99-880]|uniref:Uncharacterized protein n=1 Tax=Rhizopus delemar (strain RA 99-880 / ATCC MYA-4621 / FGSC 9543 / NRRL 43880) TaxID=246409 RepID=I1BSQ6_RHIO9|nr:hypothetical protein RO3G_03941 [Rhizopus delemar RA 99-880]|eukprot:EIE79236.1 hypothetical protein RO3G_03941 [Rhizopus delemar RA 99-880]
MANKLGRTTKFPISDKSIKRFTEGNLKQLFYYKDFVIEETSKLKGVLLKDESDFGSQSTTKEQSFLKHSNLWNLTFPNLKNGQENIFNENREKIYNLMEDVFDT